MSRRARNRRDNRAEAAEVQRADVSPYVEMDAMVRAMRVFSEQVEAWRRADEAAAQARTKLGEKQCTE
jgi:hypothetical protein